ncbi:c6 zinc finger domain containing protein [Grosmannia clavigera kw1407]|uniref:C6 zinc finger domain containing protein n=1 Tax=Grosmannia clavigera (strain kw1407 / UAMH 11150) TaxID=655863 RepID=F0XFF1_GROCL|nr:c6 zinc finger domain containing protein [Grosmannia clavigera kw1407]EFX04598.1 c6 zinc finger domain containing protein [Grosmannia clavigera kw1407]
MSNMQCDEAQPACTSTGRFCDGFDFVPEGASAVQSPSTALTYASSPFADPLEARSLQYFAERTIGELETFFPDSLWSSHVLQLALSQEGIRHALMSLAAHHERFANPCAAGEPEFAFKQHSLAVRSLLAEDDPSTATETHLVSCLIFLCIEALQNEYRSAIRLFKHGVSMVKELRRRADAAEMMQSGANPISDGIVSTIEAFINRFAVQAALLAGDVDPSLVVGDHPSYDSVVADSASFASMSEARQMILDIAVDIIAQPPGSGSSEEMALVHVTYNRWCEKFDKLVSERSNSLPAKGIALLELHKRYLGIHLAAPDITIEDPPRWDEDTAAYEELMTFAETAVGPDISVEGPTTTTATTNGMPKFHMDLGVLPILFSTVLRCRDAGVRRRAISLMKSKRLQEGIWPSTTTSQVAERIVSLEQSGDDSGPLQRVQSVAIAFGSEQKVVTIRYGLRNSVFEEVLGW